MGPPLRAPRRSPDATTENQGQGADQPRSGSGREAPMSFRELTMTDVREVLRRVQAGQSAREIARAGVVDRKTAGRYIAASRACAMQADTPLDDAFVAAVAKRVQTRAAAEPSEAW